MITLKIIHIKNLKILYLLFRKRGQEIGDRMRLCSKMLMFGK